MDATASLDSAHNTAFFKFRVFLMSLMKVVQGRLQVETTSINLARVEGEVLDALAAVVEEGGMLGDNSRTHTYNGTLQLDREARTVLLRCDTTTIII